MVISKTAQRILLRAATYLADPAHWMRGWKSGSRYTESEQVCALGAIRKATAEMGMGFNAGNAGWDLWNSVDPYREAIEALAEAAHKARPINIIPWNDSPKTIHSDIHAAFCKAVKEHVTDFDILEDTK